jgi:hypothetical protein
VTTLVRTVRFGLHAAKSFNLRATWQRGCVSSAAMLIPEETGTEDTLVIPHNVHGTAKVPANPK